MRIASFNLESFGDDTFDARALAPRIARLRPILQALDADILCLQEVNGQRRAGGGRDHAALDALLEGTPYAGFHRASGKGPPDRHGLVVVSRYPLTGCRDIRHDLVAPPSWTRRHAEPAESNGFEVTFDRPILAVTVALPNGRILHLFVVHLRAPIAAPVPGQKLTATCWKSVAGWAEGYYIAAMKRTGQALELRQAVDAVYDHEPDALIAAVGDFNAVEVESALRIVVADPDDTGNPALAGRRLVPMENRIEAARRYTVRHRGHQHMLDHILASPVLADGLERIDILNAGLADEMDDAGPDAELGSFHAPLVAQFRLPP